MSVSWLQDVAHHKWDQVSVLVGSKSLTPYLIVRVAMLDVASIQRMPKVSLPCWAGCLGRHGKAPVEFRTFTYKGRA